MAPHRLARTCFLICFTLLAIVSRAQSTQQLDDQLQAYEVKFKNLMLSRGLSYTEGKVNQKKIETVVQQYSEDISEEPNPGVGLLFYHFERDTLYHWLFGVSGLEATARLPMHIDSLLKLESSLKQSLHQQAPQAMRGAFAEVEPRSVLPLPRAVALISDILFPPLVAKAMASKKYLIILPILNLSSFPYALLRPWGNDRGMLIDSLSYSFAHNFTQFFQSVETNAMGYDANYRFANGTFNFALKRPIICGNPAFEDSCTRSLKPLPGAALEAKRVGELLNVRAWTGKAANKDLVLGYLEESNFVYLATHGWADPEDALDKSYIALSGSAECGYVTPRMIQSLNLAEKPLVILSACQTGLGRVHEAGIVGLARGFLKAGAQSVVMSLWNVSDAETEKLMTLFVDELKKPHLFFPAEHWRQAVLRYRNEGSADPLNWSAFQQFGVPYRLYGPAALLPAGER
ncbi:MAG: CHAT domain-containing protein [Cyclobacteriaceae bacterium]|jgi:hypothetical protein